MKLKDLLRQINPDNANLFHGCLLLLWRFRHHHLGTLQCRQAEASIPSKLALKQIWCSFGRFLVRTLQRAGL